MFYPFENCIFAKKMIHYTIKMDADRGLILLNEEEREVTAKEWVLSFAPRRVVALYGEMGAGKTTFIKWLCKQLGVKDAVNSPTFAIVNVYDIPCHNLPNSQSDGTEEIYHFDCYRLRNLQEAIDMGAQDYFDSGCYCLIEWPDVLESLLPEDTVIVHFHVLPTGERVLEVE